MRYYLIGMMLAGKSTIGRLIGEKYNLAYVDLDDYIVNKEQMSINEIFNKYGEDYFRKLETKYLIEVSNKYDFIILGGGTPLYNKLNGKVIFLNPSLDVLLTRINSNEISKRPLLKDINKFKEIYNNRIDKYLGISDYIINDTDTSDIVNKIGAIIFEENISN